MRLSNECSILLEETYLKENSNNLEFLEQLRNFKEKFWQGYIKEIYPEDAINLNTSLIVQMVKKELL